MNSDQVITGFQVSSAAPVVEDFGLQTHKNEPLFVVALCCSSRCLFMKIGEIKEPSTLLLYIYILT